ncbi:molybdenum cofactor cytidylyltransferase [Thermosyntropha lipolytica DSM 11003]|uniref:Molybdenum cofactor cytidylyltransferase n=1 Tax=Thermosyntropha lipolytica DSM 11003 TaxID=1123382 RepID=A0A1M5LCL5_9FIRM|nr:selenium cofactor biosynthesis protein YqeC [Thermosyntropha lipolytica]SHG62854.1 molybdenum cofactor cytidylyltransferase [Thermosyntropha lipolytica DSM 11003]
MFMDNFDFANDKKEMISFVGGGGKTSSIFKLAHELKAKNKRILVTTTTKIMVPKPEDFDELVIIPEPKLNVLQPEQGTITVLGREFLNKGEKLAGVNPGFLDDIFRSRYFDYILVEADGAKQKSLKAPAADEPVVPSLTTKTVGVIGLRVLNRKVDDEVFRSEIFKNLCGAGDIVNLEQIFKLITLPAGLFKNIPEKAEKYLFLNQVEGEPVKKAAFMLADMLGKAEFYLDGLIIGSLKEEKFYPHPQREKITGIIMAAGFSERMGQDKLLLPLKEGFSLVEKVIKEASLSDLDEVILVYQNPAVKEIGEKYGVKTVFNPEAFKGQSISVKIGIKASEPVADGYMFIPGDMPFLDKDLINKLLAVFKKSTFPIIVPFYDDDPGMPTVFSRSLRSELLNITGDEGGRSIIRKNPGKIKKVYIDKGFKGLDIDTPEELKKYMDYQEME